MLDALTKMRQLVEKPLWWAHVAVCNAGPDSVVDIENVLAIAAHTVTDAHTALEVSIKIMHSIESMPIDKLVKVEGPQELLLLVLDNVITKVN